MKSFILAVACVAGLFAFDATALTASAAPRFGYRAYNRGYYRGYYSGYGYRPYRAYGYGYAPYRYNYVSPYAYGSYYPSYYGSYYPSYYGSYGY